MHPSVPGRRLLHELSLCRHCQHHIFIHGALPLRRASRHASSLLYTAAPPPRPLKPLFSRGKSSTAGETPTNQHDFIFLPDEFVEGKPARRARRSKAKTDNAPATPTVRKFPTGRKLKAADEIPSGRTKGVKRIRKAVTASASRGAKSKPAVSKKDPVEEAPSKEGSSRGKPSKQATDAAAAQPATAAGEKSKPILRRPDSRIYEQLLPSQLEFSALDIPQPPIARLAHNLDRALFNGGVYNLRDRYSGVYNFDPYLQYVMPVDEFDWNAVRRYKTSSKDSTLATIALDNDLKYIGSTSSMTSMLTHFHYLISQWRELDMSMFSRGFSIGKAGVSRSFTEIYRAPASVILRYKDGLYAIDADKEHDSPHILMALGNALERLLTLPRDEFERYRKGNPTPITADQEPPQAYHYSKQGAFLMRSQLDAYDPRLPGTGVFDLKTRAVLPIRMSSQDWEPMKGYQILSDVGTYESYEREVHDMFRSTCLKYSLQVRMGRMEGIYLAYHNIEELFGFQFMNLAYLDRVLHGQEDACLGDQEFRASLEMVQKIFDEATAEFPAQSFRFTFSTGGGSAPLMYVFAEPMTDAELDATQRRAEAAHADYDNKLRGERDPAETDEALNDHEPTLPGSDSAETSESRPFLAWRLFVKNKVNGRSVLRPEQLRPEDKWSIEYSLERSKDMEMARSTLEATRRRRKKILTFEQAGSPEAAQAITTVTEGLVSEDIVKIVEGTKAIEDNDEANAATAVEDAETVNDAETAKEPEVEAATSHTSHASAATPQAMEQTGLTLEEFMTTRMMRNTKLKAAADSPTDAVTTTKAAPAKATPRSGPTDKHWKSYLTVLRGYSLKGLAIREEREKETKDKGTVMYTERYMMEDESQKEEEGSSSSSSSSRQLSIPAE